MTESSRHPARVRMIPSEREQHATTVPYEDMLR
jgi:hypothetical protein